MGNLKKKRNAFLRVYEKMESDLRYDNAYAQLCRDEDRDKELSAFQVMIRHTLRTRQHRKGGHQLFSARVAHELTEFGFENYLMIVEHTSETFSFVNLYKEEDSKFKEYFVADLTGDVSALHDVKEKGVKVKQVKAFYHRVPLQTYLAQNENLNVYIMETIKDDGKKFGEIPCLLVGTFLQAKDPSYFAKSTYLHTRTKAFVTPTSTSTSTSTSTFTSTSSSASTSSSTTTSSTSTSTSPSSASLPALSPSDPPAPSDTPAPTVPPGPWSISPPTAEEFNQSQMFLGNKSWF